jgi:hypothetical protein
MSIERSSALARIVLGDSNNDGFPLWLNAITLLGWVWAGAGWRR